MANREQTAKNTLSLEVVNGRKVTEDKTDGEIYVKSKNISKSVKKCVFWLLSILLFIITVFNMVNSNTSSTRDGELNRLTTLLLQLFMRESANQTESIFKT